jgi:hypothetical protein
VSSAAPMKHKISLVAVDQLEAIPKSQDAATAVGESWQPWELSKISWKTTSAC